MSSEVADRGAQLFGQMSELVSTTSVESVRDYSARSAYYLDGFYIMLFAFVGYYVLWLMRNISFISLRKLKSNYFIGAENRSSSGEYNLYVELTYHTLFIAVYIVLLTLSVVDISADIDALFGIDIASAQMVQLVRGGRLVEIIGMSLACTIALALYSVVVMSCAVLMARSDDLVHELATLKFNSLILSTLVLIPVLIMGQLELEGNIIIKIALILALLSLIAYAYRTFSLFVTKKISLLLWILYLCTIEVFPLTLIWGIFTRE